MSFEEWLQSRLTSHGFPSGPIDGVIGDKTILAIKAFQTARGLPSTGQADAATVEALRSTSVEVEDPPVRDGATVQPIWPRQPDVPAVFGAVGTNQVQIEVPFDMWLAWSKTTRVRKMTLHSRVAPSALRVLQAVGELYSAQERKTIGIDLFGGSLNVRRMRGGTAWSMHSWGIAIDFDPERNQLKWGRDKARLAQPDAELFWRQWEDEGWVSLGRARNFDWQHIQAARL